MIVGASKTEPTITRKPALAPSPQPRPAPTVRALPPEPVAQRGQNWTPIGGQSWKPIDTWTLATEIGTGVLTHALMIFCPLTRKSPCEVFGTHSGCVFGFCAIIIGCCCASG